MLSSRRPEDYANRLEWKAAYRRHTLKGRLARLRENARRKQRRQAAREALRASETREHELARLIAEQARDDRRYQYPRGPWAVNGDGSVEWAA